MKTRLFLLVGALAGTMLMPVRVAASPGGFSGRLTPYTAYAADGVGSFHLEPVPYGGPRKWSFGVYAELQRRQIEWEHGLDENWKAETLVFTVGYDVLPQITLLAGGGTSEPEIGLNSYNSAAKWLLASRIRLLNFYSFDPMKSDELYWLRIDSVIQYGQSESDRSNQELEWSELRSAITASFVARPEHLGSVDTVGIYFGPVFSHLRGYRTQIPGARARLEGKDDLGIVAGLFVNPSQRTMLKVEMNRFERDSYNFSAGFHF